MPGLNDPTQGANPALAEVLGVKPKEIAKGPVTLSGDKLTLPITKPDFGGKKSAPAAAPATPAPTAAASANPQQSVQDLLSAILGGQTGTIPQGYEGFFTHVLGPLMAQQAQAFQAPPLDPKMLAAMQPGDRSAIEKAYGQSAGSLQQMLAGASQAATIMPGIQQFVEGPMANYQKLVQQLQNALSFIPYSAQGIASMPVQAGSVLSQLGINPAASGLLGPAAAGGQAPSLSPGAAIVAGG